MKRWQYLIGGLLVWVLVAGLVPMRPVAAQAPLEVVLQRVQEYLEQQIGRDFILVNYTYAGRTWDDASLGCPTPGVNYVAETVQGFTWNITIDGDQTFELHSNQDGTLVVLCTPIDRAVLVNYRSYQGTNFVMDYPETWQVQSNVAPYEASFAPTATPTCDTAGMSVQKVSSVGANANTLIDSAVREAGLVQAMGITTPLGFGGVTITFQTVCEQTLQQYRVTVFPLTDSSGGLILRQWATLPEYLTWEAVYLAIAESFRLLDSLAAGTDTPPDGTVSGDELDPAKLLGGYSFAHSFVGDTYISNLDDLPGFRITTRGNGMRGHKYSHDGQYLAYIEPSPTQEGERVEVVQGVGRPRPISPLAAPNYPVTWTASGELIYLLPTDSADTYSLNQSLPDGSGDVVLGNITVAVDCETLSTPYLPEALYWQENGAGGNAYVLEWLPDNRFLVTTGCNGQGVGLWQNGSITELVGAEDAVLSRAVLDPARNRVAAVDANGTIYLIDLTTLEASAIEPPFPAEQLAWGHDGSQLFFSAISSVDEIVVDDPAFEARAERVLEIYPYTSQFNTLSIYTLNVVTGDMIVVWQGQGYQVGRMVAAANGIGMLFSLIPSDREYINGFSQNLIIEELRFLQPETQIYWLPPGGGTAQLLIYSQQPLLSPAIVGQLHTPLQQQ